MRPMRPKPLMPILMVMSFLQMVKSRGRTRAGLAIIRGCGFLPSTLRTVSATFSGVKPKCLNSLPAPGADSP
jgi:hypothetical protein